MTPRLLRLSVLSLPLLAAACGSPDGFSPSTGTPAANHLAVVSLSERTVRVATDGRGGVARPDEGWRSIALDHARRGRGPITVMGNRQDVRSVEAFLVEAGVSRDSIRPQVLGTGRDDWGRRVDVSYPAHVVRLPECGNFDSDTRTLFTQWTNRGSSNLGCAVQRNMAAQMSDPGDMLGGRGDQMFSGQRAVGRIGDYNTYERPRDVPIQGGTSTAGR